MPTSSNATSPVQSIPSPHFSAVDIFFPGFTAILPVIQQLQAGNLEGYVGLLCKFTILVVLGRYAQKYLRELVEAYFTTVLHFPDSSEARAMLRAWVSNQPFAQNARSSIVDVSINRSRAYADDGSDKYKKKPLYYSPWNGSFYFWHKKRLFKYQCQQRETDFFQREEVSVSCICGSQAILREFFGECRDTYLRVIQNKTSIFQNVDSDWEVAKARNIRPISSVIMNEKTKHTLLNDVQHFLDEGECGWYSRRGLLYKKGYLFYGPPGTGKSSLSLSIAGHFSLDIYVLSLAGVNDTSLTRLFGNLPPRCVILVEDIDAVGASRSPDTSSEDSGQVAPGSAEKTKSRGPLSLSGLLNVLDGVASQEGRVLIMTTNHIDHLDAALIRPGRVDWKVEFPHADKDMAARLFCMIFKRSEDDDPKMLAEDDKTVERLANEFAGKVPDMEFSPADIQSFLLQNKRSPRIAVENVHQWMDRVRDGKKVKRGDSWGLLDAQCAHPTQA